MINLDLQGKELDRSKTYPYSIQIYPELRNMLRSHAFRVSEPSPGHARCGPADSSGRETGSLPRFWPGVHVRQVFRL